MIIYTGASPLRRRGHKASQGLVGGMETPPARLGLFMPTASRDTETGLQPIIAPKIPQVITEPLITVKSVYKDRLSGWSRCG